MLSYDHLVEFCKVVRALRSDEVAQWDARRVQSALRWGVFVERAVSSMDDGQWVDLAQIVARVAQEQNVPLSADMLRAGHHELLTLLCQNPFMSQECLRAAVQAPGGQEVGCTAFKSA